MNSKELAERIDHDFSYHSCNENQIARMQAISERAKRLAHCMNASCNYTRELSTALTLLEQSVMMANAAIAREKQDG